MHRMKAPPPRDPALLRQQPACTGSSGLFFAQIAAVSKLLSSINVLFQSAAESVWVTNPPPLNKAPSQTALPSSLLNRY